MLTLHSFLRSVYYFVKAMAVSVSKKLYRHAVVMTTGTMVVAVVTLNSSGFGGGGRNALWVYAETKPQQEELLEEETEELDDITEAKVQSELTNSSDGGAVQGILLMNQTAERLTQTTKTTAENQLPERQTQNQKKEKVVKKSVSYSQEDYDVLLRIVQAEAGVCDEEGKILVANVILNRVRDDKFPNTIKQVVYQKSQFSPVSNGSIRSVKVTQETRDCVDRALAGEDYSRGALYFMNRSGARSGAASWFDSRLTFLFRHENHEFFK